MSFSLKNQHCKMGRINNALERHGDQDVIAFDLPLTTEIKKAKINALLGQYADRALFNDDAGVERPMELFELCDPLAVIERFDHAKAVVSIDKRSFEFEEVQVSKITVKPLTGGTAELTFSMRVRPGSDAEICRLLEWQNREVIVEVSGAKVAAKKSLKQGELALKVEGEDGEEKGNGAPAGESVEQRAH